MEPSEGSRTFFVLRYTIVEEPQIQLYSEPLPVPKGKAVVKPLGVGGADKYFKKNGVSYSFVGFKWARPNEEFDFPSDRFIIGKLAKRRFTETGVHVPGDIVMNHTEDWIGLIAIFDTETQHIVIEKNWRFGTPEQIETAIQAGLLKDIFEAYNCKVFIKGRTQKRLFWNLVTESTHIYALDLKLISPNLLQANKRARKALEDLKQIFQQDEIDIILKSETGQLVVPEQPVGDYITYIAEGEGSWRITSKKQGGRKKTYTSFENTDTLELPVPEPPTAVPRDIYFDAKEIPKDDVLQLVSVTHRSLERYSDD